METCSHGENGEMEASPSLGSPLGGGFDLAGRQRSISRDGRWNSLGLGRNGGAVTASICQNCHLEGGWRAKGGGTASQSPLSVCTLQYRDSALLIPSACIPYACLLFCPLVNSHYAWAGRYDGAGRGGRWTRHCGDSERLFASPSDGFVTASAYVEKRRVTKQCTGASALCIFYLFL